MTAIHKAEEPGLCRVRVIDSHTGGEPTRVVMDGAPDLGEGTMAQRLAVFRERHDAFRSAVVNEPRGSDVLVGALLCPPSDPACAAGVIFFNNVGFLGMCGHGTLGVAVTLAHCGRIQPGEHRLETPVGTVTVWLEDRNTASVENVESFRTAKDVAVNVPRFRNDPRRHRMGRQLVLPGGRGTASPEAESQRGRGIDGILVANPTIAARARGDGT